MEQYPEPRIKIHDTAKTARISMIVQDALKKEAKDGYNEIADWIDDFPELSHEEKENTKKIIASLPNEIYDEMLENARKSLRTISLNITAKFEEDRFNSKEKGRSRAYQGRNRCSHGGHIDLRGYRRFCVSTG